MRILASLAIFIGLFPGWASSVCSYADAQLQGWAVQSWESGTAQDYGWGGLTGGGGPSHYAVAVNPRTMERVFFKLKGGGRWVKTDGRPIAVPSHVQENIDRQISRRQNRRNRSN